MPLTTKEGVNVLSTWEQPKKKVLGKWMAAARRAPVSAVSLLLCLLALPPGGMGRAAAQASEDAPAGLEIKLPEGEAIGFRAVYIGSDGNQLFNARRVILGSREGGASYKQRLVETLLSGGFVGRRADRPEWLYYLSQTEIQEGQWSAVMHWYDAQQGLTPRPYTGSRLPKTGVSVAEVYIFIEALNSWMLKEQRAALPQLKGALGYARLPTEAEWEFAARGGIEMLEQHPDRFDRPYPYEELGNHEWYKQSAGNRVRDCASEHVKPNPVGLYDMLGNVEELTMSLFGPEYQQGRFGQLAIRGGNYGTSAADLSAAMRTEALTHAKDGAPYRSPKIGFRLALSTSISSMQVTPDTLDRAFAEYEQRRGLTAPGPAGQSSPAAQSDDEERAFLQTQIERVTAENGRLERSLRDLERQVVSHSAPAPDDPVLAARLRDLETLLRLREADLRSANELLNVARTDTVAVSTERDRLRSVVQRLETDKASLQTELNAVWGSLREAQSRDSTSRGRLDDLTGLLTRKGNEAEQARQQLERCRAQQIPAQPPAFQASSLVACQASLRDSQSESRHLSDVVSRLERERSSARDAVTQLRLVAERLAERDLQIEDLKRQQAQFADIGRRNTARVGDIEKRYLEALVREASANAHIGWRTLTRLSYLDTKDRQDPLFRQRYDEAAQMVRRYWDLVVKIAVETQEDVFPEVKSELEHLYRSKERAGLAEQQRKSLDLMERHVRLARSGRLSAPDNLVETFSDQPEMR